MNVTHMTIIHFAQKIFESTKYMHTGIILLVHMYGFSVMMYFIVYISKLVKLLYITYFLSFTTNISL